jgi:hypothetical protein
MGLLARPDPGKAEHRKRPVRQDRDSPAITRFRHSFRDAGLLGLNHRKLTYPHEGREESLTDSVITDANTVLELFVVNRYQGQKIPKGEKAFSITSKCCERPLGYLWRRKISNQG